MLLTFLIALMVCLIFSLAVSNLVRFRVRKYFEAIVRFM